MRVAIVADQRGVRHQLACALGGAGRVSVVLSVREPTHLGPGRAIDATIYHTTWHGSEAVRTITALSACSPVLVVANTALAMQVRAALEAGARGYLRLGADLHLLRPAVRGVAAGALVLSRCPGGFTDVAAAAQQAPADADEVRLSPREEQALQLIAQGFTHTQIATRMGVRPATVNTYVERVRAKLQLGNKAHLTRAAMTRGGISGRPGLPVGAWRNAVRLPE